MANRALVIGIDNYNDPIPKLTSAVIDAERVAKWLVGKGVVSASELWLGVSPLGGTYQATGILAGCSVFNPVADEAIRVIDQAVNAGPFSRMFFYFAGHGVSAKNELFPQEDALCFQDYSQLYSHKALSVGAIATALKGIEARERFLIIDACRNPAIPRNQMPGFLPSYPPKLRGSGLYVLNASPPGQRTISVANGGGLMTTALIQSVDRGQGAAKRWDEENGTYVVPWSRLKFAIRQQVAAIADQTTFCNDDAPAGDDPIIATFKKQDCPDVRLSFSFKPSSARTKAKLYIRRDRTTDADLCKEIDIDGRECELDLEQSDYSVWLKPDDYKSAPTLLSVGVFDTPAAVAEFELDPLSPVTGLDDIDVLEPKPTPAPPVFEYRGITSDGDGEAAMALPPDDVGSIGPGDFEYAAEEEPEKAGILMLFIDDQPVSNSDPLLTISLTTVGGEQIAWDRSQTSEVLFPGAYSVTLSAPDGTMASSQFNIVPGQETRVHLSSPISQSPSLDHALDIARARVGPDLMPSEFLGKVSTLTFSALGSLAVVQALTNHNGRARSLGLGGYWSEHQGKSGLHLLTCFEDIESEPFKPERLRLWRMHEAGSGRIGRTSQPISDLGYAEVAQEAPNDGYWAELSDLDRERRAGFKLATHILPDAVTLVVVSREFGSNDNVNGRTGLFQYLLERRLGTAELLKAVTFGEALQRGRIEMRPLADDPALQTLLNGDWFEPCSAAIAAFALYEAGDRFDEGFRFIAGELIERAPDLPDTSVIKALHLEMDGSVERARDVYRQVLDHFDAPICRSAMLYLNDAAGRLRLFGRGQRYIAEKSGQLIPHQLWTLRREDDIKRASIPRF